MGLQGFERRLERLVEGAFARAFRSRLQPVELARRIARELDLGATLGVRGRPIAPNDIEVHVSAEDHEQFATFGQTLERELALAAEEHAEEAGYELLGPARVLLSIDDRMAPGTCRVTAEVRPGPRSATTVGWLVLDDGRRVAVTEGDPVTIGRLPECDIVLADPDVSRRHAEIRVTEGAVTVCDLGSLNGTRRNGRGVPPAPGATELRDGDQVQVGGILLRYEERIVRSSR